MANPDQSPTVLLVEDDAFTRMTGVDMIEQAGFEVIEAANADEALALLAASPVSLLFTDVDMPGSMDGLALAGEVHRRWPAIRLVVTSGHHHLGAADIPDAGTFLRKPYRPEQVVAEIRQQLAG